MKIAFSVLLTALFSPLCAQEICGDNYDNDLDYLIDCADPDCPDDCGNAVACGPVLYQVRDGHTIIRYVPGTGWDVTPIYTDGNSDFGLNAIGYNVEDGFIYGIRRRGTPSGPSTDDLYRVSVGTVPGFMDLGSITSLPASSLPSSVDFYHTGDFDLHGNLYVSYKSASSLWKIDVNAVSLTATAISLPSGFTCDVADFAYNPRSNMLYGIRQSSSTLRMFKLDGSAVTDYTVSGLPSCTDNGAVFADNNGDLYCYCNTTGDLYKLTHSDPTFTTFSSSLVDNSGPALNFNDGAGCPLTDNIDEGDCCERVMELLEQLLPQEVHKPAAPTLAPDPLFPSASAAPIGTNALHQNKPNPFNKRTTIEYEIASGTARHATISVFNMSGVLMHTYPVPIAEAGALHIEGSTLQPGMYLYTLIVDDAEVDTKRMILLAE